MYYLVSASILCTIPNSKLGYNVLSQILSWDIIYRPKFRAGVLYTILEHILVYYGQDLGLVRDLGY